jgi:hypothetical protein
MKIKILSLFIFIPLLSILPQKFKIEFFPDVKLYKRYFADAISHQFSLSKHFESNEWFGNIGNSLAFSDITIDARKFQLSAGATAFNTLIKTPGHIQVYTVDYLVDIFLDSRITDDLTGRFIWGHLSAHYSDDGIVQLGKYPFSYVRDYIGLHLQNFLAQFNGKIYTGFFYNFHNEPVLDKHITIQIGGDGGINLSSDIFLFAAVDLKIKSEVDNGTTQSFQTGILFPYSSDTNLRIAFTHRRGFEERGQLYNLKNIKNTLGIYLDF